MRHTDTPTLRLVGGLHAGSPGEIIPFLHRMFARFPEVKHDPVTRQVQYASGSDQDYLRFHGIEVDRIESIPDGMVAWQIEGNTWTVLEGVHGKNVPAWQERLDWTWHDESVHGRPCGEFVAECPGEWSSDGRVKTREFTMVSNSYVGAPCDDEIRLVDYDPAWPGEYEQMNRRIAGVLGSDVALRVEHYGSTSIPGTFAKPVIDILVEVPSFDAARRRVLPAFNTPEVEYWFSDHIKLYMRDPVTGVRTHHIHMAPADHVIWEGLAFRDYLISHPDAAQRYVALKRDLAERYPTDRVAYTDAKTSFVREILESALRPL